MTDKLYIGIKGDILEGHDLSVSILFNGKLYAIELERILKIKHFKYKSNKYGYSKKEVIDIGIKYLLKNIKIQKDLDLFIINYPSNKFDLFSYKNIKLYNFEDHHFFHALSSYCASGFDESVVLTIDYSGKNQMGEEESQVGWYFKGNDFKKIFSSGLTNNSKRLGLGPIYHLISEIIGLEEGSVMGLSSYGSESYNFLIELFKFKGFEVLLDEEISKSVIGIKQIDKKSYINFSLNNTIFFNFFKELFNINSNDYKEFYGFDGFNVNIKDTKFAKLAFYLQREIELGIKYLAERLYEETGVKNICIAGGVGLNILANTKILKETKFEKVFVQPAANDSGLSLGALYYLYYILEKNTKKIEFNKIGLGVSYENEEIGEELERYKEYLTYKKSKNISKDGAEILNKGKIIGFFNGGSEFGPRALGNRSILTQSTSIETRDRVNEIKGREKWRPLAPVVLEEKVREYFELGEESPYMTFSSKVIEEKKEEIKGVVHVDGTARYQTINREMNEEYYDLLEEYYKLTGIPVLINTSFNVKGQPIVESPRDAIETYLSTDLDYLIIGDYIVEKSKKFEQFAFKAWFYELCLVFKNEEIKKLYIKNWNILKKSFFGEKKIKFGYRGSYSYSFILNNYYEVIVFDQTKNNDNGGVFSKYNNISIRFKNRLFYDEKLSSENVKIMENISKKIELNYELFKTFFII